MPNSTSSRAHPASIQVVKLALSAAFAVAVFALFGLAVGPRDRHTSDFYSFWAGGKLAGSSLYDPQRAEAIQREVSPLVKSKRYIRPPFYALALWPLGRLPFPSAYIVWWTLNVAAVMAFVWAWQFRPRAYLACALFAPLLSSFSLGQDAPLMLLVVATGARLLERKREVAGGALLSLCAIKPHLFLFVPVVLLAQRRYRAMMAMCGAGLVLFLLSSAMLGLDWPLAFIRAAVNNEHSIQSRLLGFGGLAERIGMRGVFLAIAGLTGAVVVYRFARTRSWVLSVAFATAAGVVFGPRALIYDAALCLPLLLLCFSAPLVIAAGAALIFTPAIVAEVVSCAVLFLAPALRQRHFLGDAGAESVCDQPSCPDAGNRP